MDIFRLSDQVRQTAYEIHAYHGCGYLEKIYENALVSRLRKQGLRVEQQYPIKVYDEDGTILGDYIADVVVEDELVVELKAVKGLAPEHTAQLMGYLKSTGKIHGMLLNFGAYRFQVKKYAWDPKYANRGQQGAVLVAVTLLLAASVIALAAWVHHLIT